MFLLPSLRVEGERGRPGKRTGGSWRIPNAEYRELRRKRKKAHDAALRLCVAIESRRKGLLERLHGLDQLEAAGHKIGPTEAAWGGVQMVDGKRPGTLAELAILENATAADLVRFFLAGSEPRREAIGRVLAGGEFYPRDGEFIEMQP